MKKKFLLMAAVIAGSQLIAQDTTVRSLDEVIITAAKFSQKQSTTGKVVTVIDKSLLEKSQGKTIAQLLNEQAGITINGAYNNAGSVQTVFMRGGSSGRALILVDGIPMNDPSMINSEYDLNLFSLNDVERIEICRGAQSTLYGSDAIAGVINIITIKKDVTRAFNAKLTNSYGNKNTLRSNAQLYGKINRFSYTARFARLVTDGFSSAHDSSGIRQFDKDGYDGNVANLALKYDLAPGLSIRTFIQHSRYKSDIDAGIFRDERDYGIRNSNLTAGGGLNFVKGKWNVTANYQYAELKRRYLNDSLDVPGSTLFESNRYAGRTQYLELFGSYKWASWVTVLLGSDYRYGNMNQQYYSDGIFGPYSSEFSDTSMSQGSVYGSLFFTFAEKLNIEVGGRYNDHSRYGDNYTYTFNPSFAINQHFRLFGSIASGFKAPSIFQLYDVGSGNVDLRAEKSVNYEIGLQQQHAKVGVRLVYFQRSIKNGIDYNYNSFRYYNFVRQDVKGLEAELKAGPVAGLTFTANYTLLTGEEQTQSRKNFSDTAYDYLLRRPKHSLNMQIGYQLTDALYVSVSGKYVSKRFDVGGYMADDQRLQSYFLVGAYAEYKVNTAVKLFVDGQNLGDRRFFDIRGYNAIPILVNGGLTVDL